MQEHPVLGQVTLGYSPIIDRQRAVIGTRLTVFPERPDAAPDVSALLAALLEVWPAEDAPLKLTLRSLESGRMPMAAPTAPVSLNLTGEAMLRDLLASSPPVHLMIEVPAFMAVGPELAEPLRRLSEAGNFLLIKGRPVAQLPRELLTCFSHSVIDASEERRTAAPPPPGVRSIGTLQSGVRSQADIDAAFQRGAVAAVGWPLDDPIVPAKGRASVPADLQVVMELIKRVDAEEPVGRLEDVLKNDPTLAFRLLRYINSPGFGLSVEINSFGHAVMLLGYQRLKRWLALLLVSASKDANAKAVMFAAVRRGLLMEQLVGSSTDAEMRGEMFICGVFSLLDRLLRQPVAELMKSVPVPGRVQQALLAGEGPFAPYLELVRAIEQESVFDVREGADRLMLGAYDINRAVLSALRAARQLGA
jgi:EAL and modified HD-GYP domain-containing signal transduction protein